MFSQKKSLNFSKYVPSDEALNRKVHENPRYKTVKPVIDTGYTVQKRIDNHKEKLKNCVAKKNEVFKRIKCSTFIKLAQTVAQDSLRNGSQMDEQPDTIATPKASELPERRCMPNVLMGIGELDLRNDKKKSRSVCVKPTELMPYLLLDVRDRDAFLQCHIITAKHYPSTMLSRSSGYETEEMKAYKNAHPELIVVYDDDESLAPRVATTLVERGYENIFLLTGGLKLALEICPRGLTTSSQTSPVHMLSHNAAALSHSNGKEYFSIDDVVAMSRYIDAPNRETNSNQSCRLSESMKSRPVRSYPPSNYDGSSVSSFSSATSRRGASSGLSVLEQTSQKSTASSKNTRHSHTLSNSTKNTLPNHLNTKPKKAPWK